LNSPQWDIHVITSVLKLFLRELTEPVISNEFCDKFLKANGKLLYEALVHIVKSVVYGINCMFCMLFVYC